MSNYSNNRDKDTYINFSIFGNVTVSQFIELSSHFNLIKRGVEINETL